jgi:hypothetical protein
VPPNGVDAAIMANGRPYLTSAPTIRLAACSDPELSMQPLPLCERVGSGPEWRDEPSLHRELQRAVAVARLAAGHRNVQFSFLRFVHVSRGGALKGRKKKRRVSGKKPLKKVRLCLASTHPPPPPWPFVV